MAFRGQKPASGPAAFAWAVKKTIDLMQEINYKSLPLSSSTTDFEHGIKKRPGGNAMQEAYESYRIDFR